MAVMHHRVLWQLARVSGFALLWMSVSAGSPAFVVGQEVRDDSTKIARTLLDIGFDEADLKKANVLGGAWSTADGVLSVRGGRGPKWMLRDLELTDFEMEFEVRATQQAGVLFRVPNATEGIDAFEGYYVGIHSGENRVVLGASDGQWRTIANRPELVQRDQWYRMRVRVEGNTIRVYCGETNSVEFGFPAIDGVDDGYSRGAIGFRALGGGASFRKWTIREISPGKPTRTYTNPVRSGAADPGVLFHDGVYYAYCTYTPDYPTMSNGIRLYTSRDLVSWEDRGYVITKENSWGNSRFWAPDVLLRNGKFYLYYAVDTRICVAASESPLGPFNPLSEQPMEPESIRIDAHVFQDDDGQMYFFYVHFDRGNEIWGGRLNDDMVSVDKQSLRRMVKPDQPWEQHQARIVEGPVVLKHGGLYYLTYSGSHFESPEYAVGYATSKSPLGPWEKYPLNPIMKSTSYAHGTAHHCFAPSPDGKELFIVYHRHHTLLDTEPRQLSIDRVRFAPNGNGPDVLEVWGPTSSPQIFPSGAP